MNFENARFNMVEQQIRPFGVSDSKILETMFLVKRENFIVDKHKSLGFVDGEMPLPGIQKMLKPVIEARVLQALDLEPNDNVLEVGTGSGFLTVILAKLSKMVTSIEIDQQNFEFANKNIQNVGVNNVKLILGDGLNGYPEKAPYTKILVGGAVDTVPETLLKQLAPFGKMVAIVGKFPVMHVNLYRKLADGSVSHETIFETCAEYLISTYDKPFVF